MNVLVIGGARGIGRHVVEQALEKGHTVKVLARNPAKMDISHENLEVIKGDVLDPLSVLNAVEGQDIVVFTVGILQTREPVNVFSEGTKNVLSAMHKGGVRMLIAVTGMGAGDSKGRLGLLYKLLYHSIMIKTIYDDKDRQEHLIKNSNIDWIIVRPLFLTDGPLTRSYRVLPDPKGIKIGSISRADVAHFIVEQMTSPTYLKKAPALSS